jgi:hypothetical protein
MKRLSGLLQTSIFLRRIYFNKKRGQEIKSSNKGTLKHEEHSVTFSNSQQDTREKKNMYNKKGKPS